VLRQQVCEVKQIVRSAPYRNLISTNRAFVIGFQFMYWYPCSVQHDTAWTENYCSASHPVSAFI